MRRFDAAAAARLTAAALVLWLVAATLGVLGGSTGFGHVTAQTVRPRLFDHVLPASMIGASLAAAGVVYQAVLRNPLADPYLLGASSGATLAAYLWRLPAVAALPLLGTLSPHAFALLGSAAAVLSVLAIARTRGRIEPMTAVLAGVIVNSLCGAIFLLLNAIVRDLPGTGGLLTFLVGDVGNASLSDVKTTGVLTACAFALLIPLAGRLNALRLGDDEAASLGVNVHRTRWLALGAASLMTAAGVAISGPIGFVGLVCPHLARFVVGNDSRRLLVLATALGASLLCGADLLERLLLADDRIGTLVPVGVITALIGAPFFLVLLVRERR